MDAFRSLFHRHGAASVEKQLNLTDVVGLRPWRVELTEGTIHYGNDWVFRLQVLGYTSEATKTWRWAWWMEQADVKPEMLLGAKHLKKFGERNKVPALVTPELSLADIDPDQLCMICVGITRGNSYVMVQNKSHTGAAWFLIKDPSFPLPKVSVSQLVRVFRELTARHPVDQFAAWKGYMRHHRYPVRQAGMVLIAETPQGELHARFDDDRRLVKVEAHARALTGSEAS